MNEKRIHSLRIKFLLISFASMTMAMLMVTGLILGSNYLLAQRNIRSVLRYIIENEGILPGSHDQSHGGGEDPKRNYSMVRFLNEIFNPEILRGDYDDPEFYYTNRYFAIIYDADGNISNVITRHTAVVSEKEADVYGQAALNSGSQFGRHSDYYYQVADMNEGGKIVVYLDSSDIISANSRLQYVTLGIILFGVILAAVFTVYFSKWAIASEVRYMEAQKGFITNASHELKTPLAVIRANTEMIEMLGGSNEWPESTARQVDRMSGLISNLVMIARAEENESGSESLCEDCDISTAVSETVKNFESVAAGAGKQLKKEIDSDVRMKASDAQIRQLTSLLTDNAIKYCDDGGMVQVSLSRKGRTTVLSVSNDYSDGEGKDYTRFFERFYREDQSHNTDKGGFGIGLSIAETIVKVYRGSINATWSEGRISFICELKGT